MVSLCEPICHGRDGGWGPSVLQCIAMVGTQGGNKSPLTVYHTWLSKTIVTVVHCDCKDYFRGNKGKAVTHVAKFIYCDCGGALRCMMRARIILGEQWKGYSVECTKGGLVMYQWT